MKSFPSSALENNCLSDLIRAENLIPEFPGYFGFSRNPASAGIRE